ncbi:unnamed protein product [Auanema sp. JU1783]|nr:unnamed protein product [Auanema sp. JU1783]
MSRNSTASNAVDLSTLNPQPKYKFGDGGSSKASRTSGGNNTSRSFYAVTIASIFEGKGLTTGSVGMAVMDVRTSNVDLYQFIDSTSYTRLKTKIQVEDPVEIILADSLNDRSGGLLLTEALKHALPEVTITTVHKRYFHDEKGATLIRQLANAEISNCDTVIQQQEKLAMAACAALVKYVEHVQNLLFMGNSLRFTFLDVERSCMIDAGSWKNLELIDPVGVPKIARTKASLLTLIDHTITNSGARLLRSNLLQPSADPEVLNKRYDAIEELLDDHHLLERLRDALSKVHDLESVITVCSHKAKERNLQSSEHMIMQLLKLKQTLDIVGALHQIFENVRAELLTNLRKEISDSRIAAIYELLDDALDSSVLIATKRNSITVRNQKCFAIREGISVHLDVARKAYEELYRDIERQAYETEKYLPGENTRLAYSAARGFHYLWVCKNASTVKVPSFFTNEVRNRASITFTSRNLIRYNDRINQSVAEVMFSSGSIAEEITEKICHLIPGVYKVIDFLASCDYLCSLALYAYSTATSRPQFGPSLLLKNGRHPLLDYKDQSNVIPNDTYLTPDSRFAIITGPNMAGKSTYLKQVCQLSILAQAGSLIPAEFATIPVFSRIFSRVGHNDSLVEGLSAFSLEMRDMSAILHYADSRSLIVIDELARSTSTEEGLSMSFAIAEELLHRESYTIYATHFLDISALDSRYTAVENFHFNPQVERLDDDIESIQTTHKLYKGPYTGPLYGKSNFINEK